MTDHSDLEQAARAVTAWNDGSDRSRPYSVVVDAFRPDPARVLALIEEVRKLDQVRTMLRTRRGSVRLVDIERVIDPPPTADEVRGILR